MSRTPKNKRAKTERQHRRERRLRVRSIRREPVDVTKLAEAFIELAEAQVEADAQAELARKQAARQRKVERAERQGEQDEDFQATRRPRDNRPPGKPGHSPGAGGGAA